jgi:hypothetical protein
MFDIRKISLSETNNEYNSINSLFVSLRLQKDILNIILDYGRSLSDAKLTAYTIATDMQGWAVGRGQLGAQPLSYIIVFNRLMGSNRRERIFRIYTQSAK